VHLCVHVCVRLCVCACVLGALACISKRACACVMYGFVGGWASGWGGSVDVCVC